MDVEGEGGGGDPKVKMTLPPIQSSLIFALDTSPIPLLLTSSEFDTADNIVENFHFKPLVERPWFRYTAFWL